MDLNERPFRVAGISIATLACVAAFFALLGIATALISTRQTMADALCVDATRLDFGDVWEQDAFEWTVPLTNKSGRQLHIDDFEVSCRCTSISPSQLVLAPNETKQISLVMDLRRETGKTLASGDPFAVTVYPRASSFVDGIKPFAIRGRIQTAIAEMPVEFDLGEFLYNEPEASTHRFALRGDANLVNVDVTARSDNWKAAVTSPSDTSPREWRVEVFFTSQVPLGRIEFPLYVKPQLASGQTLPATRIDVTGEAVHDVRATPRTVSFGILSRGETATQTIRLSSRTNTPMEVTSASLAADDAERIRLKWNGWTKGVRVRNQGDVAAALDLEIDVCPSNSGPFSQAVVFDTVSATEQLTVSIDLVGHVIDD